jgi:hypothetical protein
VAAPLPVLSSGLRSRVLSAALEAQDRRSQGRRVLASALGLFAMLCGVAWLGPIANEPFSYGSFPIGFSTPGSFADSRSKSAAVTVLQGDLSGGIGGVQSAGAAGSSAVSSFDRGQALLSVMGDDWLPVEAQLQSRREHFSRFQM